MRASRCYSLAATRAKLRAVKFAPSSFARAAARRAPALPASCRALAFAVSIPGVLAACGGEADYVEPATDGGAGGAETDAPAASRPLPTERLTLACGTATIDGPVLLDSPHVPNGTAVTYNSVPPSSGPHYPQWAAFGEHPAAVAPGYLVHSLEHGAVAVLYKCAGTGPGCVDVAALRAIVDATRVDPICVAPVLHRMVLAPDPTLDVPVAAAAWGFTYRADCVDAPSLRSFIDAHYGQGPEQICADGLRF